MSMHSSVSALLIFVVLLMSTTSGDSACSGIEGSEVQWPKVVGKNWYRVATRANAATSSFACTAIRPVTLASGFHRVIFQSAARRDSQVETSYFRLVSTGKNEYRMLPNAEFREHLVEEGKENGVPIKSENQFLREMKMPKTKFITDNRTYFVIIHCDDHEPTWVFAHSIYANPSDKLIARIFKRMESHGIDVSDVRRSYCARWFSKKVGRAASR